MMAGFHLKLKTKVSNFELRNDLSANINLEELRNRISALTGIPIANLKVLFGYPRKTLDLSAAGSIEKAGIKSGETLFVEEDRENDLRVVSNSATTQPSIDARAEDRSHHISNEDERMGMLGILLKKDVPADNSCLFSSLEFVISGKLNPSSRSHMRQLVAEMIASQPEEYTDAILGKPVNEYCKWILDPNSWGGAIEIAILSNYFGFEIVVVNSTTGNVSRFGEDKRYSQRVFLLFDGIHYDPLYMDFPGIDKIQTMFPTTDEKVLEDAEQLAKEAKDSRQYTNVNQFMISCQVCNSIFVGQGEAQAHAKQTGHTSFKEVTE